MDILNSKDPTVFLRPQIKTVGNCCFRSYNVISESPKKNLKLGPYLDNDDDMMNCAEAEEDIEIKVTKSGKYMSQFHVAPAFFSAIIGQKGIKRKEIEMDTDTYVKIPKQGETGDIVITGMSERNVLSARTRVHMIILQMREKQSMTHFVSVPVLSDAISRNFDVFKDKVLNGPPIRGVDETIFQNPKKFHLTIAPLVLLDDVEMDLAIQTLHDCKEEIIDPLFKNAGPMKIILSGLEIMNDDPTDVDVLYAKVKLDISKYNASFQKMADQIVDLFYKKGLIRKQYDSVKLHVTLMNSLFRKSNSDVIPQDNKRMRESFDSTYILRTFNSFHFGEANLDVIHLSIRFTTSDDKFYEALTTVRLQ